MSRLLGQMMQKVQSIKPKVEEKITELAGRHVEGFSGPVRVVASCDKQIVEIEVDGEHYGKIGKEELENHVKTASNEALKKANAVLKEETNKTMGELGLMFPGLF